MQPMKKQRRESGLDFVPSDEEGLMAVGMPSPSNERGVHPETLGAYEKKVAGMKEDVDGPVGESGETPAGRESTDPLHFPAPDGAGVGTDPCGISRRDLGSPRAERKQTSGRPTNKQELLTKFDLLRKKYRDGTVPEFTLHSDYEEMLESYNLTVKDLRVNGNIEKYRKYLKYGFFLVEFLLSRGLGFDMAGYVEHQMESMSEYDEILAEIGEDVTPGWMDSFSPTTRLLMVLIQQTVVFLGIKFVTGGSGLKFLASVIGGKKSSTTSQSSKPASTGRMRGPSIDLSGL